MLINAPVIGDLLSAILFLFSRVLRDSTPRFVRRSVGRLVGWSVSHTLLFLFVLFLLTHFKSIRSFKVKLDHFKSF